MNKETVQASIIALAVMALLALGYLGGRHFILAPLDKQIASLQKKQTLGHHLTEKEKKEVIQAFAQDSQDITALDDYSWMPLCTLTPFLGGAPAPGRQNNAQINSMQFRSAREVAMPKPNGEFRVFLTGGSTAYSSGAPSEDRTIAGYLQKRLNANQTREAASKTYEVFTMANPAWASTHERIAIENLLSELQPDLVVSRSGNNDVHWGESGNNILWFRTYFDKNIFNVIKYVYSQTRGMDIEDNLLPSSQSVAPMVVAERLLKNAQLSTFSLSNTKAPFLFVLQPTLAAVSKPLTAREQAILNKRHSELPEHQTYFKSCYQAIDLALTTSVAGATPQSGFHYLNLANVFDDYAKEEIFIDSYHFGDRGNAIIANAIANKISNISTNH